MVVEIIILIIAMLAILAIYIYMEMTGKLRKFSPEMERRLKQLEDARVIPI